MKRLIFGCGYLGLRVAKKWLAAGDDIYAVTRNPRRAQEFRLLGITPVVADITRPETLSEIPSCPTVLFCVGMDRTVYKDIRDVYVIGLQNVLTRLSDATEHLIYISSTGVYGDFGGQWIDETAETKPARDGGKACLEAEQLLANSPFANRTSVLRFAGIYGPNRVPTRDLIVSKKWKKLASDGYLNLIQVDDGVRAVQAVADDHPEGETYLVSDGNPPRRKDYYEFIADYFGMTDIPWEQSEVTPENSRSGSSKRISNQKFVQRYRFEFDYPDFKAGLAHAFDSNA